MHGTEESSTGVCSQEIKSYLYGHSGLSACFHRDNPKAKGTTSEPREREREKEEQKANGGFKENAPGTCYITCNRATVSPIPVELVLESMDKQRSTIFLNEKAFPSGSLSLIYSGNSSPPRTFFQSVPRVTRYLYFCLAEKVDGIELEEMKEEC